MKSFKLVQLLLLLFLLNWDEVSGLCSLDMTTAARCHDLEDARYIETYHLHTLRSPSHSKTLSPGNFRNLTSLRHLDLSGGHIEHIESGSFAKLGSLQTLNLADNKLSRLEAGAFDGLKNVHSLKLGDNVIRQLPSALMGLKELRLLDLSNNPLDCNCPSMKLRDALLARGVKISKKTTCAEPPSVKYASILKPDTKMTCLFAKQDEEMQADQPIDEGSGETTLLENEEDESLDEAEKDLEAEEKDLVQPKVDQNEAETLPREELSSTEQSSTMEAIDISSAEDQQSVTTVASRDDITFDDIEKDVPTKEEHLSTTIDPNLSSSSIKTDSVAVTSEASGESDADLDEGSGSEGSGMIARMPAIDFSENSADPEDSEDKTNPTSATSTSTATQSSSGFGFFDNFSSVFSNLFNAADPTMTPSTTTEKGPEENSPEENSPEEKSPEEKSPEEKSPEDEIKEDGFIPAIEESSKPELVKDVIKDLAPPTKIALPDDASKQSPRTIEAPKEIDLMETNDLSEPEMSTEPKKGIGSYIVLAALLAILVGLIGVAACKGDLCRKKRKRNDVERGTELKDMQRSLLEQNIGTTPAKIQANGNTMENVPLMNSLLPEEPKENQCSYDVCAKAPLTNGNGKSNGFSLQVIEPVKPARRVTEIEAPLNGLNPPMEAIDAPDPRSSIHSSCSDDYDIGKPPLSPGAQRVKITMQENPDSVPKTPILITRLKAGENLVKTP